jgi:hypothetical protein
MSEAESLMLLKEWADGELNAVTEPVLAKIVNKLGRLPLALKLAGAQLQKKSPEKWLERYKARRLEEKRAD